MSTRTRAPDLTPYCPVESVATINDTSLGSAEQIYDSALITFPVFDAKGPAEHAGSYEAVRFNAMKHGILSNLTVLAHEDHAEFADLLAALMYEHRPAGITEQVLVEELAAIIWRKRRVLLAEGATINRGLRSVVSFDSNSPIPAAAPFEKGLSGKGEDIKRMMMMSVERMAEVQEEAESEVRAMWTARSLLRRGGANAYKKALRALAPVSRSCWDRDVADGTVQADAESLAGYIHDILEPVLNDAATQARHQEAIKAQTLGEGLQAHKLEPLNRYETHLDRKFERTLAMILKMKELRGR